MIEYARFKNYVAQQKVAPSEEYTAKEKLLKAKYAPGDLQKYKTRKQVKAIEEELDLTTKRKSNPLSVEDTYVLIPMSEAIVERGFSKMGQIMTKNALL